MKRTVDVKINFTCNNKCLFCIQGNKRYQYKDKTTKEVKKILEEAKQKHDRVVFTGGEVTIREDLPELTAYAEELGFEKIQLQTNGRRLAYKEYCRAMIENGVNQFGIALHGPKPEIHDELTRAEGSFKQTTEAIKNLTSMNQPVATNSVITKLNYKHLPELADLLIDLDVGQYQFAFIHISKIIKNDSKLIKKIVPRKSEVMPYVKKGLQKGIDADIKVMTEAIPLCFMEGYEEYVAECGEIPGGDVYDANSKKKDFEEIRKEEGKAKAEKCKKCKYYEICEGPWKEYPEIFGWEEFEPVK